MRRNPNKDISDMRTVVISSAVSFFDILINFIAAAITGSSVLVSQGLQGVADFVTTVFLLIGVKRSKRKASSKHPFGYGRELFFWVLMSSLVAFLFSGGLAIFFSIKQLIVGYNIDTTYVALIVLLIGFLSNGYALSVSLRRLSSRSKGRSLISHIRYSSFIETKMTLLVDWIGTLSALLGMSALGLYLITGNTVFDSIGALIIGLLTSLGALIVIMDIYDLIIGRAPHPTEIAKIKRAAESVEGVQRVLDIRASTIGSGRLFVILQIHFEDSIDTDEIEILTDKIQEKVKHLVPAVESVYVEVEGPQ